MTLYVCFCVFSALSAPFFFLFLLLAASRSSPKKQEREREQAPPLFFLFYLKTHMFLSQTKNCYEACKSNANCSLILLQGNFFFGLESERAAAFPID